MMQSKETPDQRLSRLHRWCQTGRAAAAELELSQWARQGDATSGARVLLASLRAQRGDLEAAREVWPGERDLDPEQLSRDEAELLISLGSLSGRTDEAASITRRLHHGHGHDPSVGRWLAVSDAPGVADLTSDSAAQAEVLADELESHMSWVPTLVVAQQHRPTSGGIGRLKAALLRLSARFAGQAEPSLVICRALAQLAQLAGDEDEARRWAHHGLKLDPYCATLAMVLSWVPDDEENAAEPAREVLARVNSRHPGYRDVTAALKRRQAIDEGTKNRRRAA